MTATADVIVVGSGAAGLTAALNLAQSRKVAVIAKGATNEGATGWAQGGIAAVLEEGDSFEAHIDDTMIAGAGLNDQAVVEHVVAAAPRAIEHLAELGVPFAGGAEGKRWHLTREGGHSHRRIVHVADATGAAVQQALEAAAARHPNITLIPDMVAIDLITGRHAASFSTSGSVHGSTPTTGAQARRSADRARNRARDRRGAGAPISIRPLLAERPGTGSPWPGARAADSRTWNSCSSTRRASTICRSRTS